MTPPLTSIPIAHTDGPRSERVAAALVTESGARATHMAAVLEALRERPGSTACEVALSIGMDVVEVRRRLTDLRATQDAYSGEDRHCAHKVCRVATLTWYAAGDARQGSLL